jgi:hypothetical protein
MAGDPVIGRIVYGTDLDDFQAGALPAYDAQAEASPAPPSEVFYP